MAYGWRGEGLSSEGEPERMRFAARADSIGGTYQDDSERSSRRKANEAETGWSQPAHKLQTQTPPAKVLATRISMSHLVPLLEFNQCATRPGEYGNESRRWQICRDAHDLMRINSRLTTGAARLQETIVGSRDATFLALQADECLPEHDPLKALHFGIPGQSVYIDD
jgi:hypothetical protein